MLVLVWDQAAAGSADRFPTTAAFALGGWWSSPRYAFSSDDDIYLASLPDRPESTGPGRPVPGDPAAWELPLLSQGDPPRELGVLRGRLMGGERVAWELIPAEGEPDAPPRSSSPEAAG